MSLAAVSHSKRSTSEFKVALLTPGPISDAAWNAGAYEGSLRIRSSLGVQVSQVGTKTPAGFEEGVWDSASRSYRLMFGHGFEFQGAAARDSIIAGTLRVPSVEFVPDSVPVARR